MYFYHYAQNISNVAATRFQAGSLRCKSITLQNRDAAAGWIDIGGPGLAAGSGIRILSGGTYTFDCELGDTINLNEVYAIAQNNNALLTAMCELRPGDQA